MKKTEVVGPGPLDATVVWERLVREEGRGRCANCGSGDRLRARMVVPEAAGGKLVPSNGRLLCRTCDLVLETTNRYPDMVATKRPVNFWVSRALYDRLNAESAQTAFRSMAGLVRFLLSAYVKDPERFDDVVQYQDLGTDVKVNVWVEAEMYARFKEIVDRRGLTVTETLKGLIQLFEHDAGRLSDSEGRS